MGQAWRIVSGEHRGAWLYMREDGRADLVRPLTRDQVAGVIPCLEPVGRQVVESEQRKTLRQSLKAI